MKRTIALLILAVVVASMLVVGLVFRSANAGLVRSVQARERGCTLDTLQGEYLFTGGADRAPDEPLTNFPRVLAGVYTFDGAGNFSVLQTLSFGGQIRSRETGTGTYTLDSDCTGTMHFIFPAIETNWDLFVRRDGNEANIIRIDDGTIAAQSFKKR